MNPQWVIEYAVERLRAAVVQTAAAMYEVTGPLHEERARLPGRYGGLTVRCGSEAESAAAYWASWPTRSGELPPLMEKLGWQVAVDPEQGFAVAAAAALRVYGVEVCAGEIALTHAAALEYAAGPWVADTPICDVVDMGEKAPAAGNGSHPDEGGDADVWAALTRDGH